MNIEKYTINVFGQPCQAELMDFDVSDRKTWKTLFDSWKRLKMSLRDYKAREPNFPEGLSEVAFCLYSGSKKFVSLKGKGSASFDTYNLETHKAEQIKASSVESDLTSFGPKSQWDDLYFLDFYNKGKLDGTFNVYKIPTELIYTTKVNKLQTFTQQQAQGRRPRFSITDKIIKIKGIIPIAKDVQVW